MRLITFRTDNGDAIGIETGRDVIALKADGSAPRNMRAFIEAGPRALKAAQAAVDEAANASPSERKKLRKDGVLIDARKIQRLAPLRPRAILCAGHNYREHLEEKPAVPGENPEFFLKLPDLVNNPLDPIVLDPRVTKKLDHEAELAIVIGREGRHIPAGKALSYVFGYTIMNDVTARDQQIRRNARGEYDYFLGPGKNFDSAAPLGPALVTADEIPDPQTLRVRSFVNSEARQDANTAQMIWGVAQLVAFFSRFVTLQPGYLISSGSPGRTAWGWDAELGGKRAGDAKGRPKRLYLEPGDTVRCEIEKIGVLENPVAAAAKRR